MRKHRYPNRRKKPHKHKVTGHYRNGKYIQSYTRGKGKPIRKRVSRVVGKSTVNIGNPGNFDVKIYFSGFKHEDFKVNTDSFNNALAQGFNQVTTKSFPDKVTVRRLNQ